MQRCYQTRTFIDTVTGVDLSKILDGQFKILGEKVVKTDKCMVVSQLLGACARAAPPKSMPMDTINSHLKSYALSQSSNQSIKQTIKLNQLSISSTIVAFITLGYRQMALLKTHLLLGSGMRKW